MEEIAEKRDTPFLKRKLTGKMEKTKLKVRKREKSEIVEEEFKGCVRYIFASLFFQSKREHLSN